MRRLINDLAGGLLALALAIGAAAAQPSSTPFQNYIAPTPPGGDASDRIATTAFVQGALSGGSLALNAGQIIIGNASNIATPVTPSGDCTISIPGVITCTQSAGNFIVNGALTVLGALNAKSLTINGIAQPAFVSGLPPSKPGGVIYTTPFGLAAQNGTPFPNSVLISGFAGGAPTWSSVLPSGITAPNFSIVSGGVQAIFGSNGIGTFATAFYSPILTGGSTNTSNLLIASNTCATSTALNCASANAPAPGGAAGTTDMVQIATGGGIRATFLSNGNVGFGKETTPNAPFVISSNINTNLAGAIDFLDLIAADNSNANIGFLAAGTGPNHGGFIFRSSAGTVAVPLVEVASANVGQFGWGPYNGSAYTQTAQIIGLTGSTWNGSTDVTTLLQFLTKTGSGGLTQVLRLSGGVVVGSGTTDPGANTVAITGQTFASLTGSPLTGTVAYVTDGLAANCGDSACTTWGTNVTGGTGALKLLVWYNGSHWTLAGK